MPSYPETLGALKRSPFGAPDRATRSVKDEMRQNLLARLSDGGPLFAGVIGYEETVMPQIVNAILSRHNFILLGLRGQAKTRILRALTSLLDEALKTAEAIAGMAPLAAIATKEQVNAAFETGLAHGILFERRLFHGLFGSEDQKEGMSAFVDKRKADWKGK